MKNYDNIGELIKNAREEKGYSARELAKLCDISHTEISNIEKGQRVKPAILTLKAFEKYLDLDFKELASMVGYSPDTIEYGDNNIIVSYDRYDKKIKEFELEKDFLEKLLIVKKHLAVDIKEYYDPIYDYLQKQDNVDEDLLKKAQAIYKFLDDLKK
ncbi:MAG: helix-turn-helix transcriptional regulator [bacterium]|nr:helix-turn-helix domain-containing protein [Mycoplasmatota bacterium]MDD6757705.1 helix-turn-helix transcriptional regulator [bacterium]MDY2908464.1 helix-turn-helix transcriptional regulator [Candidatus Faecimonas sp.]